MQGRGVLVVVCVLYCVCVVCVCMLSVSVCVCAHLYDGGPLHLYRAVHVYDGATAVV